MLTAHRAALMALLLLGILCATARADEPRARLPIGEALDRILSPGDFPEEGLVDELAARPEDAEVAAAALPRLEGEKRFHYRIALGYVLASHGERKGLEVLVDSLERTGHFGYIYLSRVAGVDFGWNPDGSSLRRWREWLAGFSADDYRKRVEREHRAPAVREAGDADFAAAVRSLAGGAERSKVAGLFRSVATKFPLSDAAGHAEELAGLLEIDAKDDANPAAAPPGAPTQARIDALLHALRDARTVRKPIEGWSTFLAAAPGAGRPTPAVELLAIGRPAVPALLKALDDRSPTRGADGRVVLRRQDVALEILNRLLPEPTYARKASAGYLSELEPAERRAFIEDVRWWATATAGKSPEDVVLVGLERSTTREALAALRRIASDASKAPRVLEELRRMYDARSFVMRPAICELMAELGDTSKVAEVVRALDAGEYSSHMILEEDDSAAGINAQMSAQRVKDRFGKAAGPGEPDPAAMR